MPRSDYSSDPDDGSITSEGSRHEDDQAIGPTSAVTQQHLAPWQTSTRPVSPPPAIQEDDDISPSSPSRRGDTLQLSQPATEAKTVLTGPNARFRAAVLKVIRLNKMRGLSDDEPGVDVGSDTAAAIYGHIRERCSIEVTDYGPTKCRSTKLTNEALANHIAHESRTRPLWAKVRWINIGGISWDVMKALALRYEIHPLVIEDILHGRQTYSSKADYYTKHLFIRMLCHTLKAEDDDSPNIKVPHAVKSVDRSRTGSTSTPPPTYTSTTTEPPATGAEKYVDDEEVEVEQRPKMPRRTTAPPAPGDPKARLKSLASASLFGAQPWAAPGALEGDEEKAWAKSVYPDLGRPSTMRSNARKYSYQLASMFESNIDTQRQSATQATVNELKKGERVEVKLRNLYIIMFRDGMKFIFPKRGAYLIILLLRPRLSGTLISIHQDPHTTFFDPILARLRQRDTLLRNTADVSLLLQAIIDLLVDHAVKVVDKYHEQILKFERDILTKPKMNTVRFLHIASGDLTMHKRTLSPLKALIYGLRRYDLDRCIAQANSSEPGFDEKKVVGFMSHKSKIYLADVMDHMEYILASLEMFESITENLIAYTFNIVSYDMNTTMKTLTIATVIFFPLTFLTGYFGMNFQEMLSVQAHSEAFFWTLAIPVM
ncbi:hypothetical protein FRB99_001310, partial [Tulasnella sp. 403]